jgi:hypothetical protein
VLASDLADQGLSVPGRWAYPPCERKDQSGRVRKQVVAGLESNQLPTPLQGVALPSELLACMPCSSDRCWWGVLESNQLLRVDVKRVLR